MRTSLLLLTLASCSADRLAFRNVGDADAASATSAADALPELPEGAPAGADPVLAAQVAKEAQAKNTLEPREEKAFAADGWTIVNDAEQPDPALLAYDPALIASNPDGLRVQLLSTTASESAIDNIARVAQAAPSTELRLAAIVALGSSSSPRAQGALLNLLSSAAMQGDAEARHAIAPRLRPRDLDDPNAATMLTLLDSELLDDTDKSQLAFTLQLIAARDGTPLTASTSSTSAARLLQMKNLIAGAAH